MAKDALKETIEEGFDESLEELPIRYSVKDAQTGHGDEPWPNAKVIMDAMNESGYDGNIGIFHYNAGPYRGWVIGIVRILSDKEIKFLKYYKSLSLDRMEKISI